MLNSSDAKSTGLLYAVALCLALLAAVAIVPAVALADGEGAALTAGDSSIGQAMEALPQEDSQDSAEEPAQEPVQEPEQESTQEMYRLYNMNSGEHFYTASAYERDALVNIGWFYEGVGWVAPETSSVPVFRLYNPNVGDHHYTTSAVERDHLASVGWRDEGTGWYSDAQERITIYRTYNPNARTGTHHYTFNANERDNLVSLGWHDEQIGWYAVEGGHEESMTYNFNHWRAILSHVSGSGAVSAMGGSISAEALASINSCLNTNVPIGFVALNTKTGKCVARNADMRMFGASTIKAPFCAAICQYSAPGVAGMRTTMYNTITYSSNADYNTLYARYGQNYIRRLANEAGVSLDLKYTGCYADYSPRDLAKMWASIDNYLVNGGANVDLYKGLFGMGAFYKEGWMTSGTWCGQLYHMGGVQDDVVYAIMTRYGRPHANMWNIKNAIVAAVS